MTSSSTSRKHHLILAFALSEPSSWPQMRRRRPLSRTYLKETLAIMCVLHAALTQQPLPPCFILARRIIAPGLHRRVWPAFPHRWLCSLRVAVQGFLKMIFCQWQKHVIIDFERIDQLESTGCDAELLLSLLLIIL